MDDKTKDLVAQIIDRGTRSATDIAKASDLEYFWMWARLTHSLEESYPIDPQILLSFIVTHLEGELPSSVERRLIRLDMKAFEGRHKLKTVARRVSTISWKHMELGFNNDNPAQDHQVKQVLKKAKNDPSHAVIPSSAVLLNDLKRVLGSIDSSPLGLRDKAMIALTWSSGRRRSEANGLTMESIIRTSPTAYIFELRNTKQSKSSDDTLQFKVSGLAKKMLDEWIDCAGIETGPLFRRVFKNGRVSESGISDKQFYRVIKRRFFEAGIENWESITPHSLRSGFVTELGKQGGNVGDGMALTGQSLQTFMSYYQAGEAESNSATGLLDSDI